MGSDQSKPNEDKSTASSIALSPAPVSGGRRRSNRRGNRRGRGKTMRGGDDKKMYGGMHKGKRHSKGSRRNKSKSRSRGRRHH